VPYPTAMDVHVLDVDCDYNPAARNSVRVLINAAPSSTMDHLMPDTRRRPHDVRSHQVSDLLTTEKRITGKADLRAVSA
jgi:hypothetical protein